MIGILLVSHGTFGESLVQNVCHVLNTRPPLLAQFGVAAQDDPLDLLPVIRRLVEELDTGEGVLILTDILGATPANLVLKLLDPGRVEGVAGVNLPMLLRVLTYRTHGMTTLMQKAISGGHDGVITMR